MKLNPDCIRAILLTVEENSTISRGILIDSYNFTKYENLKDFDYEEISYHIRQCDLEGLFTKLSTYHRQHYCIADLSPKGHEFIQNVRDDTIWNSVKNKAKNIGTLSLPILVTMAKNFLTN